MWLDSRTKRATAYRHLIAGWFSAECRLVSPDDQGGLFAFSDFADACDMGRRCGLTEECKPAATPREHAQIAIGRPQHDGKLVDQSSELLGVENPESRESRDSGVGHGSQKRTPTRLTRPARRGPCATARRARTASAGRRCPQATHR